MYIGSGDTTSLLAGLNTKSHAKLLQRFVSDIIPYYNAKNSPIDALRTGAILEDRYFLILPDEYYAQYKSVCEELDVLKSSIDFALLDKGEIVDFEETKTCNFNDFLILQNANIEYVKNKYKNNYNQVQFQLLCSGLNEASLVFIAVYSYKDEDNYIRDIKENEVVKFRVKRDELVINKIKERGLIYQQIKDAYTK